MRLDAVAKARDPAAFLIYCQQRREIAGASAQRVGEGPQSAHRFPVAREKDVSGQGRMRRDDVRVRNARDDYAPRERG